MASPWLRPSSQLIWKLIGNALEVGAGNLWKMVKITLLVSFCQIYSNKLPKRLLSSFKISEFDALATQALKFAGPYMQVFTVFPARPPMRLANLHLWENGAVA